MTTEARNLLNVPKAEKANFGTNFIRQAVCELRFPTLFELTEVGKPPPVSFANALRKSYPAYATSMFMDGQSESPQSSHTFRSKGAAWTVTLRAAAVILETTSYTSFDEFRTRLELVVNAAKKVIDSEYFTRIGLRYTNNLPYHPESVGEWLNPEISATLAGGTFGDVEEAYSRFLGKTAIGGFFFQHGLAHAKTPSGIKETKYLLDLDIFSEDIEVENAMKTVDQLHEIEYSLFYWSLGPAAKAALGPSRLEVKSNA